MTFDGGQERIDGIGLDLVGRGPIDPFVAEVFGDIEFSVGIPPGEKQGELFEFSFGLGFAGGYEIGVLEAEVGIDFDFGGVDSGFFVEFTVGGLAIVFTWVEVSLGEVPAISMFHEQELGLRRSAKKDEAGGENFGLIHGGLAFGKNEARMVPES